MKKSVLLSILVAFVFLTCTEEKPKEVKLTEQDEFVRLYTGDKDIAEYKFISFNEIKKKEFIKDFNQKLTSFMDSVIVFHNWKGQIDNISINEKYPFSYISCDITFPLIENRSIKFSCKYSQLTETIQEDSLYSRFKSIPARGVVYFDGVVARDVKNETIYTPHTDDLILVSPYIEFNLIDISSVPIKHSISHTLKRCLIQNKVFIDLVKQKENKEIDEATLDMKAKALKLDSLSENLNPWERYYLDKYVRYGIHDMFRANTKSAY